MGSSLLAIKLINLAKISKICSAILVMLLIGRINFFQCSGLIPSRPGAVAFLKELMSLANVFQVILITCSSVGL